MNRYDIALGKIPPSRPLIAEYSQVAVPADSIATTATSPLDNTYVMVNRNNDAFSFSGNPNNSNGDIGWTMRETWGIGIANPSAVVARININGA